MYTDCIEPDYGHVNQDGYVRICPTPRRLGGRLVMKHRYEWEIVNGPIPQGYEINHKCKNRKCFNLDHLECIPKSEHRAKDNAQRYKARASAILRYKKENPEATQKLIASLFGVSKSGVSKILERNY